MGLGEIVEAPSLQLGKEAMVGTAMVVSGRLLTISLDSAALDVLVSQILQQPISVGLGDPAPRSWPQMVVHRDPTIRAQIHGLRCRPRALVATALPKALRCTPNTNGPRWPGDSGIRQRSGLGVASVVVAAERAQCVAARYGVEDVTPQVLSSHQGIALHDMSIIPSSHDYEHVK